MLQASEHMPSAILITSNQSVIEFCCGDELTIREKDLNSASSSSELALNSSRFDENVIVSTDDEQLCMHHSIGSSYHNTNKSICSLQLAHKSDQKQNESQTINDVSMFDSPTRL